MISTLETGAGKETLVCISYIHYLVRFQKDKDNMQALINLGSKINAMNSVYVKKLGLCVRQTDVGAQKIDKSHLKIFEMVMASFLLQDKLEKV